MDRQEVHALGERLLAEYDQLAAGEPCEYEAWQTVTEVAQRVEPQAAWALVKDLLPRVSDQQIGYLAAGPVEDLIDFHWGDFEGAMAEVARKDIS